MTTKNEPRDMLSASMEDPEFRAQFEREWYVEEFLTGIEEQMKKTGMTRKALAERLGCSPANITQLFRRENNLTAETMVDLALGVGCRLRSLLDSVDAAAAPWAPAHKCDPWTETAGAQIIRFPLRKTGGSLYAESITLPDLETQNDLAPNETKIAK
jgi:transcriptional regulator with XRE-family HTH domain